MTQLVLELFPGAGLLGRAFEAAGYCVVRGPDPLWGGDVRELHVPPGRFDGIIGGPPCQTFSVGNHGQETGINLIPEFLRIVREAKPRWAIMENVPPARRAAPDWPTVVLRDWDCGGHTHRLRQFWFYGLTPPLRPPKRPGEPAYSVLATSWKNRGKNQQDRPLRTPQEAAQLQGHPEIPDRMLGALPKGMTERSKETLIVHVLGNGVPMAMGSYLAAHVIREIDPTNAPYVRVEYNVGYTIPNTPEGIALAKQAISEDVGMGGAAGLIEDVALHVRPGAVADVPGWAWPDDEDELEADMIASGYEWTCQRCEYVNHEIEVLEESHCDVCGAHHVFSDFHHAYG